MKRTQNWVARLNKYYTDLKSEKSYDTELEGWIILYKAELGVWNVL